MTEATDKELSAVERVRRFHASASLTARKLAGLMAAAPVSLPVVNLIQQTLLKEESNSVHVAEVFMGGLLKREPSAQMFLGENIEYEFFEGVRSLLTETTPISSTVSVLDVLSSYVAQKLGKSVRRFTAFVSQYWDWDESSQQKSKPFAHLTSQVLRRLGGDYAVLAERLEQPIRREVFRLTESTSVVETLPSNSTLPRAEQLELFEFSEDATDQPEPATVPDEKLSLELQPFQFQTVTLEVQEQGASGKQTIIVPRRETLEALQWVELLPEQVPLEMVLIPKGQFLMGAPETEDDSRSSERPQHQVTVPEFLMGKYPVTQVQWKAVAGLPKVRQELNPKPSEFKGDDLPVEQVSWLDAVEFCDRLSRHTERQYRLPSEAEWEYACRAGTTTPFHFGETINTEVANYDGNNTYSVGHRGIYRRETSPVGSFGVASRFGLYDMHGNVWEWCADHWHKSYERPPSKGSGWFNVGVEKTGDRLLRGGSWDNYPRLCRSACRHHNFAVIRDHTFGFRVVCVLSKAL
jgi:formylglycine-generating enzyme required for sulfatase activity